MPVDPTDPEYYTYAGLTRDPSGSSPPTMKSLAPKPEIVKKLTVICDNDNHYFFENVERPEIFSGLTLEIREGGKTTAEFFLQHVIGWLVTED